MIAMASMAMGATYSGTDLDSAITLNTTPGESAKFTYTLDLDVAAIVDNLVSPTTTLGSNKGAVLFVFTNGTNTDHTIGLGNYGQLGLALQRVTNSTDVSGEAPITFNGNYFKGVSDSSSSLNKGDSGNAEWYNFANEAFWADATSASLTIKNSPTASLLYSTLTITKPNDVVYTVTSSNTHGVISTYAASTSFKVNSNYVTGVNLTIPEPTTATLSLLALAGLAARRRRK